MPNAALEEAIKEAYTLADPEVVCLDTLELNHPSLTGSIYLVRDRVEHTLTLENNEAVLFEACGFRMSLPEVSDGGVVELNLSIDNVDRRISDFLNEAKKYNNPVTVKYRPYLSTDPTKPQMDPPLTLSLTDIKVTDIEVTGRATFADVINKKFPTEIYTRERFPSLAN